MTALIFICTGEPYWQYLSPILADVERFFPADVLLFTDSPNPWPVTRQVYAPQSEWPGPTLFRYHTILKEKEWLSKYDYIFFLDVDMRIIRPIGDEIYAEGITVTQHPGYMRRKGTPETNPVSAACCPSIGVGQYVMGGFNGGTSKAFLEMAETLKTNIDADYKKGFIARWHDESHLNRYVHDHPPARILPGSYCCGNSNAHITWVCKGTPLRPAVDGRQPGQSKVMPLLPKQQKKPAPSFHHPFYPPSRKYPDDVKEEK